ncbi:MAG: hypothetical protein O7A09_11275 [Proteobacteria bacterium]|nr:hypothetical protein [Pseudomonadota bacterium]
MRPSLVLLITLTAIALLGQRGPSGPQVDESGRGKRLRAGACAVDITPVVGVNHTDPIYLAGFDNDRVATGVHDAIWARGLVLQRGDTKIGLVTLDLVGYFYNEVQTIRSLVDPALGFDSITVSSTHNHEGPDTMGLWGPEQTITGADLGYLDFVNDSVVACLEQADAAKVTAAIKFVTGSTVGASLPPWPDLVADGEVLRELVVEPLEADPILVQGDAGPVINPSVPAFQIRRHVPIRRRIRQLLAWLFRFGERPFPDLSPLRQTIATVVNYASHPESLGASNTLIASDFPHFMREVLEAEYGGVAIYVSADLGVLQGPLDVDVADAQTGEPVPRRTFAFAERMGELLAERAMLALDAEDRWRARPEIEVATNGPIEVIVENPFFFALGQLNVFGRRGLMTNAELQPFVETEAQALRIGPAILAVTPNELDPQIGNLYREQMTGVEHRFIIGLGNDEIGYQMPEAKFNPSCFLCFLEVFLGIEEQCPVLETLDCSTVFQNNIGPAADPQLQAVLQGVIAEVNP